MTVNHNTKHLGKSRWGGHYSICYNILKNIQTLRYKRRLYNKSWGKQIEPTERIKKILKKVEHICKKSFKMKVTKQPF
jgi:hypothetical protein